MNANAYLTDDCLTVSGELNFATVVHLWNESLPLLAKHQVLQIDLSRVTSANSAALALLLEWLKYARDEKKTITFQNMPPQIQSIASMAGIDKILK